MKYKYSDLKSTEKEPIKYFDIFFNSNYLTNIKNDFLPNPNDPEFYNSGICEINEEKLTYTIYYQSEANGHEEVVGNTSYWVVDEYMDTYKTYSFYDYLQTELREEYYKSRDLINIYLTEQTSVDKAKLQCLILLDSLQFLLLKSQNEEQYKEFKECQRPLEALIRLLLKKYPSFCPSYSASSILGKIKLKNWEPEENEFSKTLSNSVFEDLVNFEDLNGDLIFNVDGDKAELILDLKLLFYGSFDELKKEIHFCCEAGVAHYIIRQLNTYKPITLKKIEDTNKVLIRESSFLEKNSSPAASKFSSSPYKSSLKVKIDQLFNKHLR